LGSVELPITEPTVSLLAVPGSTPIPSPAVPLRPHLPGYLLLAGTQRLRRSQSLKILREIERAPFAPPDEVRASQFRQLSALLAHAEAKVPYYRELFRSLGIRARDIRSLGDFARLPILTKDVIRERWRDLIREDVPLERLSPHFSGGSTGVPLRFYRERAYMDASDAGTFRNFQQCGWRLGEMIAFFWGSNERLQRMSRAEFELRQRARRMYQFDPFHSGPAEMEQWLRRWPSLGATIAYGYASTVARFAEFIESSGRTVPRLRGVFTTAEKLYPAQRDVIGRVFGCRVFDLYGSSEVQNIAAECRDGRMHVIADFVVLETDRSAARPGAPTPLLATSLRNYAMPFIRYRNEDCAELSDEACDCGNHFPLMTLNVARVSDNFVFPDGRVVHGEFFTHLMYGSDGIVNFQFHQTARDRITLWIVPGPGDAGARDKATASAVAQIAALTPLPVHVDVRETDAIPLSNAGKHRFTRSDVR
jgi:phenylacetate-coenzyme A ligase PaaK-like adenylate-forming protein